MIHADMLFLMTDVDCLYDKNPRSNPDARSIDVVEDIESLEADGTFFFFFFIAIAAAFPQVCCTPFTRCIANT